MDIFAIKIFNEVMSFCSRFKCSASDRVVQHIIYFQIFQKKPSLSEIITFACGRIDGKFK